VTDEQQSPICPGCGDALVPAVGDDLTEGDGTQGTTTSDPGVSRECNNPDCPHKDHDLASPADDQEWLNTPGTEGGANGGA
jgi:hypothetical protein